MAGVDVEPLRRGQPQKTFTEDDLHVRHFMRGAVEAPDPQGTVPRRVAAIRN